MSVPGVPLGQQPHSVQIVSSTWARDSHDLFDFEAHHLHTKTLAVQRSMTCIRTSTDVQMIGQHDTIPPNADQLLRLVQKEGVFWVDKASTASNSKKLWLVVRDLATCGQRLTEGDIIKLGRFKFRVRQMVASDCNGAQAELKFDETSAQTCAADLTKMEELASTMCRICLLEGSAEDDPLISPCDCKGSIQYVHVGCLRHWIKGRLNLSENSTSFFYRPLPCELCKSVYPSYLHTTHRNGTSERTPLVEVPRTKAPFIALENMVRDSQQHSTRGLHVISLADNKLLKLGRGHESDVRIADVSISRCHATIRFHRGQFVLEDHNSKFGTLIAMKKPRALEANSAISIQVGRTVLSLSLQPNLDNNVLSLSQSNLDGGGVDMAPRLQQMAGSNASDERALRLSLLNRGSSTLTTDDGPQTGTTPDWQQQPQQQQPPPTGPPNGSASPHGGASSGDAHRWATF